MEKIYFVNILKLYLYSEYNCYTDAAFKNEFYFGFSYKF